jgi:hypothetical protein
MSWAAFEKDALVLLASAHANGGEDVTAHRMLAEALAIDCRTGDRNSEARTLCARGALVARAGRVEAARSDLEAAHRIACELALADVAASAKAWLAALPGGDVGAAVAGLAARPAADGPAIRSALWQAAHDRAHLAEAKRLLDGLLARNPEHRESMLANVRLHREIVAACGEQGL